MKDLIVKLKGIKLTNFKNIIKSEISFEDKGDIINTLGIYGPNGSGKTAIVESLNILKNLFMDLPFQKDLYYLINVLSNDLTLEYFLSFKYLKEEYIIKYLVKFSKSKNLDYNTEKENIVNIIREKIEVLDSSNKNLAYIDLKKDLKKCIIDCYDEFLNNQNDFIYKDISLAASHLSNELSKSVIFQKMFRDSLPKTGVLQKVLKGLNFYAITNLFVVGMRETSFISALDNMALNIRCDNESLISSGKILLNLFSSSTLPKELLEDITPQLDQINSVMDKLIPGVKVSYKKINDSLDKNGNDISTIQLVSSIGDSLIPLKYESEGVKKLIALCSAMIAMYNNESVCLVVDELDSGVFEYLLGELTKILHEGAKGQLIFTSHNLRLLEVLPKQCICFSTTNPKKCFIKMANVKPNNNLRDFYYRSILLGGQKEELFSEIEEYEIERALRKCKNEI